MSSFATRVEALRAPLVKALRAETAEGPAVLADPIRGAADKLMKAAPVDVVPELERWRQELDHFESRELDVQAALVGRGLRLCYELAGAPATRPRRAAHKGPATLGAPTIALTGIGPAMADKLADRGIHTVEDLLWWLPIDYLDTRDRVGVSDACVDERVGSRVATYGVVDSCRFCRRGRRRWLDVRIADRDGDCKARLVVRFFGAYGPMAKRFEAGNEVSLAGVLRRRSGTFEMNNPEVLTEGGRAVLPRYSEIVGVPGKTLRKVCAAAATLAGDLDSVVPEAVRERLGLSSLGEAVRRIHDPAGGDGDALAADGDDDELARAARGESVWHRRVAWEELFLLSLAVGRRRLAARADEAAECPDSADVRERALAALQFTLTCAQQRAVSDISRDLASTVPMNRLLQGDVGSGKTAVAFVAAAQVAAAGAQVALLAPTEILAEQHHRNLAELCERASLRCALLTASVPKPVAATIKARLAAGDIDLVVGTHSLIAGSVQFSDLALAIVDEQHRFGVAQRVQLRRKGRAAAHLLVMTATPIPRTLALTAYGDLDVSVLDEMPPGREPVTTHWFHGEDRRAATYRSLSRRVADGERVFVVCPLVEAREDASREWADAVSTCERLTRGLPQARVGLVHGRMAADERDRAMAAFRGGELDVLVATTVVEVGVDVPEATVMVIEDADHFGLSQLHQLRGRVGRGGGESNCVLLTRGNVTDDAHSRLEVMARTTDGFEIAEEDLRIRGPGELIGERQAGAPRLRFGRLSDHFELLRQAREQADRTLAADPELSQPEHAAARAQLERRSGLDRAFDAESG